MKVFVVGLSSHGEPIVSQKDCFLNLPIPYEPYILRFVIFSWSQVIHRGSFWCNAPPDRNTPFDRNKYYEHPLCQSAGSSDGHGHNLDHGATFTNDIHVDITITCSGPFSFYITYMPPHKDYFHLHSPSMSFTDGECDTPILACTNKFYFTVSSGFTLNGQPLDLNALAIQTVLSKLMGPIDTWEPKLAAIATKGYNMIHFTPLQQRGSSDSPFSIYDQHAFDPICFPNGESDIAKLVTAMESKHNLLALTDVVLNHTAHNSVWLADHPEATYNVDTAPHLKPALDLDSKLLEFSEQLSDLGLPSEIHNSADLDAIMSKVRSHVLESLKLWEYYVVDVDSILTKVMEIVHDQDAYDDVQPVIVPDSDRDNISTIAKFVAHRAGKNFERFGDSRFFRTLNLDLLMGIVKFLFADMGRPHYEASVRRILDEINEPLYQEYDNDVHTIISQLYNRIKYMRLDDNGPRLGPITKSSPLIETYFTRISTTAGGANQKVAMANNGWVWGGNPLKDFADPDSRAYLRREVIIWGDCVKLRYGSSPSDSPFLWNHMKEYVQMLAKYFHGFRIDNCHSTPLHVGEYMLDMARLVRPNLYVAAELFTGSERMDKIFVERLGITSLIREAMQAWSVQELSTLVQKHGGRPIGSFSRQPLSVHGQKWDLEEEIFLVHPSPIHAWFMDCTHDNESPAQKRTIEDTLPTAALVAMCSCAIGSTVGYDECYPHSLNVVSETRRYSFGGGISEIKKLLNQYHVEMGQAGADETYTHHEGQYITFHRVNPKTGKGYFLIARTKFHPDGDQKLNDVFLQGTKAKCLFAVSLINESQGYSNGAMNGKAKDLHGMPTRVEQLNPFNIEWDQHGRQSIIRAPLSQDFPQGSIAVIATQQDFVDEELDNMVRSGAAEAIRNLSLVDLNVLLYKCESEERDCTNGEYGTYNVPGFGPLPYAGLQGWASLLRDIVAENNLGHPFCNNLRSGFWALDYTIDRLKTYINVSHEQYNQLQPFVDWLESRFDRIRRLPPFLVPRYFSLVLYTAYAACEKHAFSLMSKSILKSGVLVHALALTSVQMVGNVKSASLLPFEPTSSMAAGLPHFSSSYMRCWGRDVFIALPGLLLTTGRFEDAKAHILGFAATCKHGLIPNLLDSGRNPRYNARDAAWFFLHSVQEYTRIVPDGEQILSERVKRRFPADDTWVDVEDPRAFSYESSLREIVYEILARHAKGITFREANAGPNLDSQMKDEGFNQHIYVDWENGMIFGGNPYNCGTWMDKMGESEKAGNKGIPGTPRDGAAIEIIGLLKSALRWVNHLRKKGHFEWTHVVTQDDQKVSLEEWEEKIQQSFERCYYVPVYPADDSKFDVDSSIVHRRGIYKDLYRSFKPYEDYQLRPNFAVAMVVAPELFNVDHAVEAIHIADKVLRGPVGMATLDPEDYNYRPYYNNGEDSTNFATSKGRNYHQGPEWVWCTGFFLRAFMSFDMKRPARAGEDLSETFQQLRTRLAGHVAWIRDSTWRGLTELTNKHGQLCNDSSPTQAWSTATLLDLFHDARLIGRRA